MSGPVRTEYSNAILPSLTPDKAIGVVKDRLNNAKLLNDELADWLKERARIEENYANELDKLSRRGPLGHESALGTFTSVWNELTRSARDISSASLDYAKKTRSDIEGPIRGFSQRSVQWSEVRQLHDGLSGVAKDLIDNEENVSKVQHKKSSSGKLESAQTSLAEVRSQWENQAPYVLGQFEIADESRFVLLRDSLTRLETLEADRGQAIVKSSEKVLNSILSFDPIEEVRSFAAQIVAGNVAISSSGVGGGTGASRITSRSHHDTSSHHSDEPDHHFNRGGLVGNIHRPSRDDSSSVHSGSQPSSGGAHKLRSKVGSIFRGGRKKKEVPVSVSASAAASRPIQAPAGGRRATSSSDVYTPVEPSIAAIRKQKQEERDQLERQQPSQPTYDQQLQQQQQQQQSQTSKPLPPPSRKVNGQVPTQHSSTNEDEEYDEDNQPLSNLVSGQQPFRVNIRKDVIAEEKEDADVALSNVTTTLRQKPTISGRGSRGRRDIQSRLFTEIEASDVEQQTQQDSSPSAVGQQFFNQLQSFPQSNGFSHEPVSPPTSQSFGSVLPAVSEDGNSREIQPVQQPVQPAQQSIQPPQYPALVTSNINPTTDNIFTPHSPGATSVGGLPGSVIGGAVAGVGAGIAAGAAAISHTNHSTVSPTTSTITTPTTTTSIPFTNGTEIKAVPIFTPTNPNPTSPTDFPTPPFARAHSDVHSIHSLQSSATGTTSSLKHPELPSTAGLVGSVVELINVNIKDGVVNKVFVGGEVSLGYNDTTAPGSIYVKINNKSVPFDKLVTNHGLLSTAAEPDTFKIDFANPISASIVGTRQGSKAFMYSITGEFLSQNPLIFTPIWRIEEKQSSLMLTYELSDKFPGEELEINDLVISVPIEGGLATSAQNKPVASFNKDRQRVTWRFAEPVIVKKGQKERLLCRFSTEGYAKEASSGLDIRFRITDPAASQISQVSVDYTTKPQEDPFSDEATNNSTVSLSSHLNWIPVTLSRTIVTGKYTAHSELNVSER